MPTLGISLSNVSKVFAREDGGERHIALHDANLSVEAGEFFCLIGPSGCGKTTLLHLVAGFEAPTGGEVRVFGDPIAGPGPDRGVVFQSDQALFSWLTVYENVEFGLRMRGVPGAERRRLVELNLELVGLTEHRRRFPHELSGGMKQRVQIARILANDPKILLMDEPFAALDAQTRRRMQHELATIWSRTGKTVLFITHDIAEAITLGDRVGILTRGPSARIKGVVSIDIPRPREERMTTRFVELYNELSAEIEAESVAVM